MSPASQFDYVRGNPDNLVGSADADMGDIQGPFYDLKDWLNGAGSIAAPPLVSALPAGPQNGQEIYLDVSTDVIWHLRYRAAQAHWNFLGGPSNLAAGGIGINLTTTPTVITGFNNLAWVPINGAYDMRLDAQAQNGGAGSGVASFALGKTTGTTLGNIDIVMTGSARVAGFSVASLTLVAGDQLRVLGSCGAGQTISTQGVALSVVPRYLTG